MKLEVSPGIPLMKPFFLNLCKHKSKHCFHAWTKVLQANINPQPPIFFNRTSLKPLDWEGAGNLTHTWLILCVRVGRPETVEKSSNSHKVTQSGNVQRRTPLFDSVQSSWQIVFLHLQLEYLNLEEQSIVVISFCKFGLSPETLIWLVVMVTARWGGACVITDHSRITFYPWSTFDLCLLQSSCK